MSKNYSDLAQSIIKLVGGKENIRNLIHCQTRLRFDLTDESKVKVQELQKLAGVAGVINSGGQFQVVIGTHVSEVYEEVASLLGDVEEMAGKDVGKRKTFYL